MTRAGEQPRLDRGLEDREKLLSPVGSVGADEHQDLNAPAIGRQAANLLRRSLRIV